MGEYIHIKARDGEFQAYIARPVVKGAPAVVVRLSRQTDSCADTAGASDVDIIK